MNSVHNQAVRTPPPKNDILTIQGIISSNPSHTTSFRSKNMSAKL